MTNLKASKRKLIDLSIYLENDVISDPPGGRPEIKYLNHQDSFGTLAPFFPGLEKDDMPDGEAWAIETVKLSTHSGTGRASW